jgi:diguanylate cyclase (GGDEF)-like protein
MILCPDTDLSGACTVAEGIRSAVARHDFAMVGRKTCSFGVSEYRPGDTPQAIVKRADGALYAAKHGGRNQVCAAD